MKKLIASLLSLAIIFSISIPAFAFESTSASNQSEKTIDEILSDFNIKRIKLTMSQSNTPSVFSSTQSSGISENLASICHETINKLSDLGYNVYEVNSNTYHQA